MAEQPVLEVQRMSGLCLGHGWWHQQELPTPVGDWRGRDTEPPSRELQQENEVDTVLGKINQRRERETSPDGSMDLEEEQTPPGFDCTVPLAL